MSYSNQFVLFVLFSCQLHVGQCRLGRGLVKTMQHIHRAELASPARLADEVAFLPAALSLQDTPVEKAIAGSPEVAV
jgi:hypothetical protein